jgi:hypothetical protein
LQEGYFVMAQEARSKASKASKARSKQQSKANKKNKYGHQVCTRFRSYDEDDEARSRLEPT